MDTREQRGRIIAATGLVRKTKADSMIWEVPSQSEKGYYRVDLSLDEPSCTCLDYELRKRPCKHIFAIAHIVVAQGNPDGSTTITETLTLTKKKTYPQKWREYNAAQTGEQDRFQELLRDLCAGVQEPAVQRRGRPSIPLADAIFAATFKVYSCFSGRRFMCDLREAHRRNMISRVPHYNTIFDYFEDDGLTPILLDLIKQSSLPLASVETDFAVDSSGFSTCRFTRWYDKKYCRVREKADWVKTNIMCGVKTNIITAIEIGEQDANDSPFLRPLLKTTAQSFTISEVSGDKAYGSVKNANAVAATGGTPFIPYKSNVHAKGGGMWEKMYYFFMFKRDEFLQKYHKRSNIESTFSMLKRKFGDSIRSKTDTAMVNETLCKVLCHNLVVLIHEAHELGIEPNFWASTT